MKNIIKSLALFVLVIAAFSCEEEDYFNEGSEGPIELVSIYSITNISGSNVPVKINIYRNKSLIVEYSSSVNATNFVSSGYADSSNETNYQVTVSKMVNGTPVNYVVSADKSTGDGTLTIDGGTARTIKISEKEVYN